MQIEARTGGCLCGRVRYTVSGPLRAITACHCSQCRKSTGSFYTSTSAADAHLAIAEAGALKWYRSSAFAQRGFCGSCGSNLFWKADGSPKTAITAGTLDGDSGLAIAKHIFVADKGDYYEIAGDAPQHSGAG